MEILYITLLIIVFISLTALRMGMIASALTDWNYYVYKYMHHCRLHYTEFEKPMCRINENEVTRGEAILVFFMFWKINPDYFFDFKPDWEDIHEIFILKKHD